MRVDEAMVERAATCMIERDYGHGWRDKFGDHADEQFSAYAAQARAALTAALGDTHVIVPIVPTVKMLVAAQEEWLCVRASEERGSFIWDAMLTAAKDAP